MTGYRRPKVASVPGIKFLLSCVNSGALMLTTSTVGRAGVSESQVVDREAVIVGFASSHSGGGERDRCL